jgi:eukaryotic-like serine/threonine-protein kinase
MTPGTDIGHYHILRPLGKGGMGEVYLAHDTKLDRDVAVKVLPESLKSDPERLARFRREAKAAASLQHPNIGTIHALEEVDDQLFIVMEYVDGQTLAEAIPEGGMDLDAFFATFIPLADALAHAHDQGRVHRDIKPGNIMLAKDGTPKILDFGLARIMPVEETSDPDAPTITMKSDETDPSAMHDSPRLMGTPQYMSPEQAESQELDHRTDIFSFGVVMYEALTGKKAFEGSSRTSLLGRIVNEEPKPVTSIKAVTPYSLWLAIERCLRKEAVARTQTSSVLVNDLRGVRRDVEAGTVLVDASTLPEPQDLDVAPVPPMRIPFWRQSGALIVVGILVAGAALTTWLFKPVREPPLKKYQLPTHTISLTAPYDFMKISPDGTMVAYTSNGRLWLQDLGQLSPREVPDSKDAIDPFWSPSSEFVGYSQGAAFMKVSVQGGASTLLYNVPGVSINDWAHGAWGKDGRIVYTMDGILHSISERGGEPRVILRPDSAAGEVTFHNVEYLPDGKTLVFKVNKRSSPDEIALLSDGSRTRIVSGTELEMQLGYPAYSPSGHILYQHGYIPGNSIWAVPFSLSALTVTGEPFPVVQDGTWPSVSEDGTLVYITTPARAAKDQLVWVDRTGAILDTIGSQWSDAGSPRLSPDGTRVILTATVGGNTDLWMYELGRETERRLTSDPAWDGHAVWSPEGDRIAFGSRRDGTIDIFLREVDRRSNVQPFADGPQLQLGESWSHDGKTLLFGDRRDSDVWYVPLTEARKPSKLVQSSFNQWPGDFSPDGLYVSYDSNETGQQETSVTRFPSGEGQWPVSVNGGIHSRWRGNEIFYVEDNTMMVARVTTDQGFQIGTPQSLFAGEQIQANLWAVNVGGITGFPSYDVSADGQHFVIVQRVDEGDAPTITVVQNWSAEFKDRN